MDNSIKKWLVRAGSFLILFGFFIPSMAVSCTALGLTQEQPFSMSQAASSEYGTGILYLVLFGALIALVISFLPPKDKQQRIYFIIGEAVGLALGVLSYLIAIISLSGQFTQYGMDFKIKPGFFVLFLGYGLAAFGLVSDFFEPAFNKVVSNQNYNPPPGSNPISYPSSPTYDSLPPKNLQESGPHLELIKGNTPPIVVISSADFHVGRGSQNHLFVGDKQVSRVHIRICEARGQWFIQDQNSSSGTFVNGKRIQAQPLNDGDQIRIGETTFKFRM